MSVRAGIYEAVRASRLVGVDISGITLRPDLYKQAYAECVRGAAAMTGEPPWFDVHILGLIICVTPDFE